LTSIVLLVFLSLLFSAIEEKSGKTYSVVSTFDSYIKNINESNANRKGRIRMLPEDFSSLRHSVGCLSDDGTIISEGIDFFLADDFCTALEFRGTVFGDYTCIIPIELCGSDSSKLINYTTTTYTTLGDYLSIGIKVLLIMIAWILLVHLIYYKALLYIIYGSNKKEKE